jgi:hypothetical protein
MSQKHMPRLGSAIASTILSLCSAVSLVGVDKAQAATLTYNIDGNNLSFFKVNNSSLTGIGVEKVAVSEGTFYWASSSLPVRGKEYYDLAGVTGLFYQGEFRGLEQASGGDQLFLELRDPPDEAVGFEGGSSYQLSYSTSWSLYTRPIYTQLEESEIWEILYWESRLSGYSQVIYESSQDIDRRFYDDDVYYTLVATEPEPVPEPLTAGGTALALAGLSWLKHKKKMAA